MGQKVHPKANRLGIIQFWDSTWIADSKTYRENVLEDYRIRRFLKKRLKSASVSRFEIDRKAQRLIVRVITARPGVVVGRGGQGLDALRKELQSITGRKSIQVDVMEVARADIDAQLVAESIAQQLERRIAFRRAMKQAIQRATASGAKGIKVMVSGRLGGAEIARTEWAKEGRIPLHTFRADVDYGFEEAVTLFGIIGVKVWIFKGEVLPGETATSNLKQRFQPDGGGDEGRGGHGGQPGGGGGRRGKQRRGGPGGGPGGGGGGRSGQQQHQQSQPQAPAAESSESAAPSGSPESGSAE